MVAMARENGRGEDPIIRQRIGRAFIELRIMRLNALRTLSGHESGELSREGTINKLYWANWHRRLGELCMDVMGPERVLYAMDYPYQLSSDEVAAYDRMDMDARTRAREQCRPRM